MPLKVWETEVAKYTFLFVVVDEVSCFLHTIIFTLTSLTRSTYTCLRFYQLLSQVYNTCLQEHKDVMWLFNKVSSSHIKLIMNTVVRN